MIGRIKEGVSKGHWYSDLNCWFNLKPRHDNNYAYEVIEGPYKGNIIFSSNVVLSGEDQVMQKLSSHIDTKQRTFESGAIRDNNVGKIRPDLISPYMLKALAKVLADGANHYGERNWEKGIPQEVFKESAARHYLQWMNNEEDEDHAAKLIFNVMGWIHNRDKEDKQLKLELK